MKLAYCNAWVFCYDVRMDTSYQGFTNKETHDFFRANERELDKMGAAMLVTSHSRYSAQIADFCKLLRMHFPKASKKIDWWQVAELAIEG